MKLSTEAIASVNENACFRRQERGPLKPEKNSDTGVCLKPAGDSHSSTARRTPFLRENKQKDGHTEDRKALF